MSAEYKPTLRFNMSETNRITAASYAVGIKPATWMKRIILENAPPLVSDNPLSVRVAEFDNDMGWNLIHYADALGYAEALNFDHDGEVAKYLGSFTKVDEGEIWIDTDKLPPVPTDLLSVKARAIHLCRVILMAHIKVQLVKEGLA